MRFISAVAVGISLASLAVPQTASAESQAQRAYDACVGYYNKTFRFLKNYKAIVAGVTGNQSRCFWVYGASSVSAARRKALANCERVQAKCFVYADSSGHSSWSARISRMGGDDGTKNNGSQAANAFVSSFISGMAGALAQPTYRSAPVYSAPARRVPAYHPPSEPKARPTFSCYYKGFNNCGGDAVR